MKKVYIYTDGACRGNPGPGGWGAILRYLDHEKEFYGAETYTTNNRMELQAAISALTALKTPSEVILVTDSRYVQQGIEQWLSNWKRKNWLTADKKPVKNQDLWIQLDHLNQQHQVSWQWVKGHAGHKENERADKLANQAIDDLLNKD